MTAQRDLDTCIPPIIKSTKWLCWFPTSLSQLYRMRRGRTTNTTHSSHSKAVQFLTAMSISTLLTLVTFVPLLFRFGITSPIPQGDTDYLPASYPDPAPCYGNISWIHDPSIIYEDGTYWRFSTSGNIAVATAPSIKGPWTYRGALLPEGTKIQVAPNQDIWVKLIFALLPLT